MYQLFEQTDRLHYFEEMSEAMHVMGPWVVFSESQVRDHGLWCQVRQAATGGMANNNIREWYYPTNGGLTPLDNMVNDSTPYQELKCDNQNGLV